MLKRRQTHIPPPVLDSDQTDGGFMIRYIDRL